MDEQGFSPWMWAIHFEDNEALRLLLARVSTIPATDSSGRRKLAVAASLNNAFAVRLLLEIGVPVDWPAIDGATPLLIAAASGYVDLMRMLLAAGANPNSHDQHRDTPLMAATRVGSIGAVKLLSGRRSRVGAGWWCARQRVFLGFRKRSAHLPDAATTADLRARLVRSKRPRAWQRWTFSLRLLRRGPTFSRRRPDRDAESARTWRQFGHLAIPCSAR
jgi:hypothetical protein